MNNAIAELVVDVLGALRSQFYCDLPARDYVRDERFLTAALATYGHECRQRGWLFDAGFLKGELLGLLQTFKRHGVEPKWMPVYLQGAIRRHIGTRAEELQAAARNVPKNVTRIVAGVQPVVVVEKSATELLALLYADVRKMKRTRAGALKPRTKEPTLL